jgi:ribosome-binding factor A
MAEKRRLDRLNRQLLAELSALIDSEIDDPRVGIVAVTRVRLSSDLRHARVWVHTLEDETRRKTALEGLKSARGFLRRQLSHRLAHLKRIPELTFDYDDSVDEASRVEELLARIEQQDG